MARNQAPTDLEEKLNRQLAQRDMQLTAQRLRGHASDLRKLADRVDQEAAAIETTTESET